MAIFISQAGQEAVFLCLNHHPPCHLCVPCRLAEQDRKLYSFDPFGYVVFSLAFFLERTGSCIPLPR